MNKNKLLARQTSAALITCLLLPSLLTTRAAAQEQEVYPEQAERHLSELKAILDDEGSNYAS